MDTQTIYIVGYMAAGKSQVAQGIAEQLGYTFWDTDLYLENRFRLRVSDMFEKFGESYFREKESMALDELLGSYQAVIATGGGLPIYGDNLEKMLQSGKVIYLKYSLQDLIERAELCKRTRPRIAHLSGADLSAKVQEDLHLRAPFYEKAHLTIECSLEGITLTTPQIIQEIIQKID